MVAAASDCVARIAVKGLGESMPRPLPALPGASEPPERERPNSAASNTSHPKEYRMMALQQIRNSLEPFANQQEQLQIHHHMQVGVGVPGVGQGQPHQQSSQHHLHSVKRSEMSSASSTASESSYGYSAFSALPQKTPVRPPVNITGKIFARRKYLKKFEFYLWKMNGLLRLFVSFSDASW